MAAFGSGSDDPFYRGDTLIFDGVATLSAALLDLTAYTIWCTGKYRRSDADSDAVFEKTVGDGITLLTQSGLTKGGFTVTIDPADTSGLNYKTTLEYDVQVKDASGHIYTADSGTIVVSLDVTRATS